MDLPKFVIENEKETQERLFAEFYENVRSRRTHLLKVEVDPLGLQRILVSTFTAAQKNNLAKKTTSSHWEKKMGIFLIHFPNIVDFLFHYLVVDIVKDLRSIASVRPIEY